MVGSTREPSSEHVLGQPLPWRYHQSIMSVHTRKRGVVEREDGGDIDARVLGHEGETLLC